MLNIVKGQKHFDKKAPRLLRKQKPDRKQYQSRFMTLKLTKDCELLKEEYGTHANVARILGLTPRHYLRIRSGDVWLTDTVRLFITLVAKILRYKHRSKELRNMVPKLDYKDETD